MSDAAGPEDAAGQVAGVSRLFDALADVYDGVGVDFFQPIAADLIRAMGVTAGEQWLDVGCGRGAVLLEVARLASPGGTVTGFDISAEMVRVCELAVHEQGLSNVTVHVDDAQAPRSVEGPFSAISSCLVLFFLPDPASALRAWLPLLAPGGRLGVTTFGRLDERWQHVDEVFVPFLPPALKDARTSGARGPFGSDEGVEDLVRSAGYADVRTVTGSVPVRFADAEQWHAFSWSTGQRAMWLAVPEGERPAVRAEAERRLAGYAGSDGVIEFEQPIRHTLARRSE